MRALNLAGAVVLLGLANLIVSAQPGGPVVNDGSQNVVSAKARKNAKESDRLRKHQIAVFKELLLSRILGNIKQMDEASLRLSVRNQVLKYLMRVGPQSESNKFTASKIAQEALSDLEDHAEEIPAPMAAYLISDLGVWLEKHEPALLERFLTIKKRTSPAQTNDIRSLLSLKNGEARAAKRIDQELDAGRDIDGLGFHLRELQNRNFPELEPLLTRIVEIAEVGLVPSLQTIDNIREVYLQSDTSNVLKQRFLSLIVTRTQPALFHEDSGRQNAYDLLAASLPSIQRLDPSLYNKAITQALVMRAALTATQLNAEARRDRLNTSLDAISDLLEEAELAKSSGERNELLAAAAQLALDQNKIAQSLEIAIRLDVDGSLRDFWQGWADQFLKDVIGQSLGLKDFELAGKAVDQISSPLTKVEGLILIFQHAQRNNDETTGARVFDEAIRIAGSDFDSWEKARAFFILSVTTERVDSPRGGDLLESAIKALNSVVPPKVGSAGREPQVRFVRNLGFASGPLIKSFKNFSRIDENRALSLVDKVQRADLRSFAMLGVLLGFEEL